jgi:uncharacterized protein (DUF1499 family)
VTRRAFGIGAAAALAALAGGAALFRLAPADPAHWHTDPADGASGPASHAERFVLAQEPAAALAAFDAVARATPRTRRLAGSPEEGRVTYVTRSAFWGFPDYTTVAARAVTGGAEVFVHARARFGRQDLGVNARRVRGWIAALGAGA